MRKGFYIAVEGIDGVGKTTQSNRLAKLLRSRGVKTVLTGEPTHMAVGRLIKEGLRSGGKYSEEVMALLFAADRLMHAEKVIKPALRNGMTVVSDRSVISSLAYQAVATRRRKWVGWINRYAAKPDVVVYISLKPEKALKRLRRFSAQRYERLRFLKAVDRMYRLVLRRGWRVVWVDGDGTVEEVGERIARGLAKFIPELRR
ncbi:MAG: dTMP kinase [Candidatus Caldarchaeum sp.]